MILDLTTPENKGYVQAISAQISGGEQPADLDTFNDFLSKYSVIDVSNPPVVQAAAKSCGSGPCCHGLTITVSF